MSQKSSVTQATKSVSQALMPDNAKGNAHRGQYGDGRLQPTTEFVRTAYNAVDVKSHTGHAIYLSRNGDVFGTGGNIYGPLSSYGIGDKAISWGKIFESYGRKLVTG